MKYLKTYEEVYYDSLKDCEGYVDANDLVGQHLWFHTNRTHKRNGRNGLIGIYNSSINGKKEGYAGRYTNEVRISDPIFFQTSEAGAETIKKTDKRSLIAGVSGIVIPTNNNTENMVRITYNPFDVAYFHEIDDEDKEEIISADEVYFNATEEGNWEIWAKNPKYKIEKSFENVDMMNQIWNQFMDTIKECFIEFEDEGWYWSSGSENPNSFAPYQSIKRFSLEYPPHFNCIMLKENDEYVPAELRKEYIDWTGRITSNGEIIWDTKELTNKEFGDITDGPIYDRAEDFLTSVKRLQSESGLDFNFSYNNRGGEMKIIIQGRI
jgi:hypothetical protein